MTGCLAKPLPGVTWPQPLMATVTAPESFSEAELLATLAANNPATETVTTATATIRLPKRRMGKPLFSAGNVGRLRPVAAGYDYVANRSRPRSLRGHSGTLAQES